MAVEGVLPEAVRTHRKMGGYSFIYLLFFLLTTWDRDHVYHIYRWYEAGRSYMCAVGQELNLNNVGTGEMAW